MLRPGTIREKHLLIIVITLSGILLAGFSIFNNELREFLPVLSFLPVLVFRLKNLRTGRIISIVTFIAIVILFNGSLLLKTEGGSNSFFLLTGMYLIMHFISCIQRKVQSELSDKLNREKAKTESTNLSKQEFTSSLSHQIRTPLNDLVVLNNLLASLGLSKEKKDIVETLVASTNNLVEIVNAITEISDNSLPDREPDYSSFQMKDLTRGTMDFYNKKELKGINFILNDRDLGNEVVLGDPILIKQVLLTVIESLTRRPDVKKDLNISMDITSLEIENNMIKYFLRISADSPIFRSADFLEKIMTGNIDTLTATSLDEELQFMSLTYSLRLTRILDGEMKAGMEKGLSWMILSFSLPKSESAFSMGKPGDLPETQSKRKKDPGEANILLVEDNELNQKILQLGLKDHVKRIDIAGNGKLALDSFGNTMYDVILMDVQMDVMDGITATRKIRELEKSTGSHVPIIAVTANALLGDKERCISAGMDDYISKPFKIEELLEKIKTLI